MRKLDVNKESNHLEVYIAFSYCVGIKRGVENIYSSQKEESVGY